MDTDVQSFVNSHNNDEGYAGRIDVVGLPPLKWSSAMFRKTEEDHGEQDVAKRNEARRDCHEATAG